MNIHEHMLAACDDAFSFAAGSYKRAAITNEVVTFTKTGYFLACLWVKLDPVHITATEMTLAQYQENNDENAFKYDPFIHNNGVYLAGE